VLFRSGDSGRVPQLLGLVVCDHGVDDLAEIAVQDVGEPTS